MKKVTTFGGGGGHAQILKALKEISGILITAICPSTDTGGSTGLLQKEYKSNGYIGDLTKCIIALSRDKPLAKALSYRYDHGPLNTHSVKNLLFLALEKTSNSADALETMWRVCGLGSHRVLPVTNEKTELCADLAIGNKIIGETNIDQIAKNPLWNANTHAILRVYLSPKVSASKAVKNTIKDTDYIIVCPGDLFSSILPVLLPNKVKENIQKSKAKIIIVLNIMTKKGETDNYTVPDFIKIIEKYLGRKADYIICNNAPIPRKIMVKYSLENKVEIGKLKTKFDKRIHFAPLAEITKNGQVTSSVKALKEIINNII